MHTPGPWEIIRHTGEIVANNRRVASTAQNNGLYSAPDARLIAAAPELLDALEDAAHELHLFCELHDRDEDAAAVLQKAREVIQKAKGD